MTKSQLWQIDIILHESFYRRFQVIAQMASISMYIMTQVTGLQ